MKRRRTQRSAVDNIVFEGGGVHGIGYIGCIELLEDMQLRAGVKNIGGASIGALMAFAMACKIPAIQIYCDACEIGRGNLTGNICTARSLYNLARQWGLYDLRKSMTPWLTALFTRYGCTPSMTFAQHYEKFGVAIYLVVLNRTRCRIEIKSHVDSPTMPIFDVLLAAMSFPGYFMPIQLPGSTDLYVDGGTVNNFPLYMFETGTTLGIRSVSEHSLFFAHEINYEPPPPSSLIDYFEGMISMMIESGQQRYEKPSDAERTYFMKMPADINSMDFDISAARKQEMMLNGYGGLQRYLLARAS